MADNAQKSILPLLLQPWSVDFDDPASLPLIEPDSTPFAFENLPSNATRRSRTRAFLKVQDGCNNRCTFCIVTVARGASRSAPLAALVREVQDHVAAGVQEVVLTGVHLGSYGTRSRRGSAYALTGIRVDALLSETEVRRLRLSSLEPWEIAPGFFDSWRGYPGRLCPHLHLPLQAGTDRHAGDGASMHHGIVWGAGGRGARGDS